MDTYSDSYGYYRIVTIRHFRDKKRRYIEERGLCRCAISAVFLRHMLECMNHNFPSWPIHRQLKC